MAKSLMSCSCTVLVIWGLTVMMMMMSCSFSSVDASGEYQHLGLGWIPNGSLVGEEEYEMDNEINRRILATSNYISYGALQKNSVPCSRRGASYYNCQNGGQANPYNRGCSQITRCRS